MGMWNLFNNNTKVNIYQTKTIHIHGDALPWTIPIAASHANGKSKSTYLLLLLEMAHPNTHTYIFKINKQHQKATIYMSHGANASYTKNSFFFGAVISLGKCRNLNFGGRQTEREIQRYANLWNGFMGLKIGKIMKKIMAAVTRKDEQQMKPEADVDHYDIQLLFDVQWTNEDN